MGLSIPKIPNPINVVKDTANFVKDTSVSVVKQTVSNTKSGIENTKDFAVHSAVSAFRAEENLRKFALNKTADAANATVNVAKSGFGRIGHPGTANPPAAQGLKFSESKGASELAYARNNAKVGDVYKFPDGKEWKVADVQDKSNGFRAIALRPVDPNDKRVIVAFAGSDEGRDWFDNVAQGAGFKPSQYRDAVNFANKWKGIAGNDVTLTGHSLGGGLASYASVKTGLKATAINSAPLSIPNLGLDPRVIGRVTQYYVPGEVLSVENAANPVDFRVGNSIAVEGRYSIFNPKSVVRNHSLGNVAPDIGMPTFVRHD